MIDSLYNLLTKIGITRGQDKVLHWIAGFIGATITAYLFGAVVGFFVGGALGLGNEIHDKYYDGVVDFFDFFFTWSAGIVGVMAIGLLLGRDGIYNIAFSEAVFFAVLAVYGGLIYWLFADKD